MDEFLKSLELSGEGLTRGFTIQEFLLGLVLSALLITASSFSLDERVELNTMS